MAAGPDRELGVAGGEHPADLIRADEGGVLSRHRERGGEQQIPRAARFAQTRRFGRGDGGKDLGPGQAGGQAGVEGVAVRHAEGERRTGGGLLGILLGGRGEGGVGVQPLGRVFGFRRGKDSGLDAVNGAALLVNRVGAGGREIGRKAVADHRHPHRAERRRQQRKKGQGDFVGKFHGSTSWWSVTPHASSRVQGRASRLAAA